MANTSRIHCVREAYDGEHKTLIVKLGKGSRQHAFGRGHNYQSFRRNAPQYVRSRKGPAVTFSLAQPNFSRWKKVTHIQSDRAYNLVYAASGKAVQHHPTVVAYTYSQRRCAIVMGRTSGYPTARTRPFNFFEPV
jgi:hypothetical protein